jgi:hypothetical protein
VTSTITPDDFAAQVIAEVASTGLIDDNTIRARDRVTDLAKAVRILEERDPDIASRFKLHADTLIDEADVMSEHVAANGSTPSVPDSPPNLVELLDDLDVLLALFVVFGSDAARHAVAAWIVHTHVLAAFDSTPRLSIQSAELGSGKTRLLEVLELVVAHPLHTANTSTAALVRTAAGDNTPTILLDEADTVLGPYVAKDHEDLRGFINAGHRRGVPAMRMRPAGRDFVLETFETFAPVALAGIGTLPATITDRSIIVDLKRRLPTERVSPFRFRDAREATVELLEHLIEWAADEALIDTLADARPTMPPGIVDRPADVWEPLVVIGDHAGDPWSTRIRDACRTLVGDRSASHSDGIGLLADCHRVIGSDQRIPSAELTRRLVELEDAPWGDIAGKRLDARGLAARLRPYGIRPKTMRHADGTNGKGYERSAFGDSWDRYLTPTPDEPPSEVAVTTVTPSQLPGCDGS